MNNAKSRKVTTKTLVQTALLVAISIVLTRVGSIMVLPTQRVGFGETPLLIAGFLFGPVIGGITGLIADLVGFVISPLGPFHPGITLGSILWGVISGLFGRYFRKRGYNKDAFSFKRVFLAVAVAMVIISVISNTYWLSRLYGKGFIVMLPARILNAVISTPIQSYIITALMKHLRVIVE